MNNKKGSIIQTVIGAVLLIAGIALCVNTYVVKGNKAYAFSLLVAIIGVVVLISGICGIFSKKEKKCPSRKTSRNLKSSINRLTLPKDNKFISNTETFLPKVKKYKDPNDKEVGYCSKKVMEEKLIKQFDYSELLALRTGTVKIRKMQMTAKPKAKLLFHIEDNKTNTYRSPYNNI